MKKTAASETENLKDTFTAAAEKTAEMAKSFIENSEKQFEAALNTSKAIFDKFTKQYTGKDDTSFVSESIENSVNATTKWFKESSKTMADLYDRQVSFIFDSFSGFIESSEDFMKTMKDSKLGGGAFHTSVNIFLKNIEESAEVTKKMFAGIIDTVTDESDKNFLKDISDLMQDTYNKQTEQLLKFNKNLLDAANLNSTINLNKDLSDKLQKDLEKNLEASKRIIKSISDSYIKDNNFSAQKGKKMLNEIFAEIDVVTKNNMKSWTGWFDEIYGNEGKSTESSEKTTKKGQNNN